MVPQAHAQPRPRIEMIRRIYAASNAFRLPDRPELCESLGPLDRGRIVPDRRVDVIRAAVRGHRAFVGTAAAGVVGAVRLDNVVLDERVLGPAVDS